MIKATDHLRSTSLHSAPLQLHSTTSMASHNSGSIRYVYSPINFPDTPEARRNTAAISAAHARRAAAHQSILLSLPATEPVPNTNNTHAHGTTLAPHQLFAAPAESNQEQPPDPIQFVELDDIRRSCREQSRAASRSDLIC